MVELERSVSKLEAERTATAEGQMLYDLWKVCSKACRVPDTAQHSQSFCETIVRSGYLTGLQRSEAAV